ncbi:MAG: 2-octaprenyl-6-methoxyphenol hydroxylase [Candidatus Tokpelaia hoelldobleri]|uniref:2-octaprenyl-6-methoxyphenol hydroxylase n=1 Tax=Candidatus Tokpelaia hoelldobleri TaxID=1902579 RepID=A0A1U9JUI5_9HYPH|nr:MAG: 2-octaprenyl-6-methoxyphenol hydroxylase [Candidatus Tokpelaia hoelldoblerii]
MVEEAGRTEAFSCKTAVIGSGPAGMIAALKLALDHEDIVLVGAEPAAADMRTTALMMPAISVLQTLNVWQDIAPRAAALKTMRIVDGTTRLIRSPAVSFRAAELGEDAFGYNMPNTVLNAALAQAVATSPNIRRLDTTATAFEHKENSVRISLASGETIETALVVAADGRNSAARDAAGIRVRQWNYPQTAVILGFAHELPHNNISTEFHTESGPFTQVPLPGNHSALVWVCKPAKAQHLLGLGTQALGAEIERNMLSMLGKITVETAAQTWPMGGIVPRAFAARRTVLIGEAAHVFPPIGAQGLNLGIRDVLDLAAAIATHPADPGAEQVIRHYNRRRTPDIWARTGFVHTLNRALLSDFLPVQMLRSAGLEMLRRTAPLRTLFMREGMQPGMGLRALLLQRKQSKIS